ncbi:MAG TPA: hypothetical protein VGN12_25325 [Pirellulales bacterium]|jgi:hypothetical protein
MKMKIKKFDKAQLLEFLTVHVEKGVFGLFILGFLFFCIGALKHSPYDKVPKDFMDAASRVDSKVTASTFDPAADVPPVKELPEPRDVQDVVWRTDTGWNRPAFDMKKRRPEPKFLALQDLHIAPGYGAILVRAPAADGEKPGAAPQAAAPRANPSGGLRGALNAAGGAAPDPGAARPAAGSSVKGKQWAVITGLIPYASQVKEYRTAFRDVRFAQADLDYPNYHSFEIERAEVPPGNSADAELKWVLLDRKQAEAEEATIGEIAVDPVDPVFEDRTLTKPIPKISGKEHDRSVGHPKIPVGPQPQGGGNAAPQAAPAGGGDGLRGRGGGLRGGNPGANRAVVANSTPSVLVDNKLFRVFDFSVVPGKTYRYRVRLVLDNPNYGVGAQYLANAAFAKGLTRQAPWSEPSAEVNIPRGFSMLAGGIKPSRNVNDGKLEVVLRMWDQKEAVDASRLVELVRGQVANFAAEEVPIDRGNGSPEPRLIPFNTDMLVVDMTGGDSLAIPGGPRARAPSQVLVLEPNGKLTVRSELADAETYEPTKQRLKQLQEAMKPPPEKDEEDDKGKKGKPEGGGLRGLGGAAAKATGGAKGGK